MNEIRRLLIGAARTSDGTPSGEAAAQVAVGAIEAPSHVIAAESAALVRWFAGHLNSPSRLDWDDDDDVIADQTLDSAMGGINHGGRCTSPNIGLAADRCMTALVQLARERDDERRLASAKLYARSRDPLGIAFTGVQLVRALAEFTGDAEAALDAIELVELARGEII
jgi:hypothetical protein